MSRLADLETVRADLVARMAVCSSDQNYAVMGRLLVDVVKQIDELGDGVEEKATGLSDFQKRLAEREQRTAKTARRAKSG